MEKIIPPGLNYADIKPEAIENQIRIIKYTPMATVQQANQNDVIRFHLQGNGFFDPYSAYIRVEVDFGQIINPANAVGSISGKFLDRSAHSIFSRLVIRSQGTELERIEHYDVVAAMINDMVYSQEQRLLHHYEGFAAKQSTNIGVINHRSTSIAPMQALSLLSPLGGDAVTQHAMDIGAWKMTRPQQLLTRGGLNGAGAFVLNGVNFVAGNTVETLAPAISFDSPLALNGDGAVITVGDMYNADMNDPVTDNAGLVLNAAADNNPMMQVGQDYYMSPTKAVFCLPIYSGIIGILMPDKKLLPLSLLPLEVELTVNPYGVYGVGTQTTRAFTVTKCEIFSHTLFFEQELHRSLEAIVAETGIFLHYQSFYLGPVNTYNANAGDIRGYNHIGVYLKSIQSIHWTYIYNNYESDGGPRKLNFSSHGLSSLQVRNGMDLIPSEPIRGQVGRHAGTRRGVINDHSQFLIETYKAWNKMHDPLSDSAITPLNYQIDVSIQERPLTLAAWFKQQKQIGRAQYAVTLEGEELGQQKTIITGKKSVMPFDLNIDGYKGLPTVSYMLLFLKADFICYVRPDLVVTRLGL